MFIHCNYPGCDEPINLLLGKCKALPELDLWFHPECYEKWEKANSANDEKTDGAL